MVVGEKPENPDTGRLALTSPACKKTDPVILTGNPNDPCEVKTPELTDVPFQEAGIFREAGDPGSPVGYFKGGIVKVKVSGAVTLTSGQQARLKIDPLDPTKYTQFTPDPAGDEVYSFCFALTPATTDGDWVDAQIDPQYMGEA